MPSGCGIGGDAFWLIWDAGRGTPARAQRVGRAPAAADAAALRATGLAAIPLRGPLSITRPGRRPLVGRRPRAVRPPAALDDPGPGHRAGTRRVPGLGRVHRRGRGDGAVARRGDRAEPGSSRSTGRDGRPWRPGERVRLPALAATLETLADDGFDAFYDGDLAERQARGLAAAGSPIAAADLARPRSTWGEPIATDYRGRPRHDPSAEQLRARGARDPRRSSAASSRRRLRAFGPDGVTDPAGSTSASRRPSSRWPTATPYLTDPAFRDMPVDAAARQEHAPRSSPTGSIRGVPPAPAPATNRPAAGRSTSPRSTARATRSA